jgi:hypothetical protein
MNKFILVFLFVLSVLSTITFPQVSSAAKSDFLPIIQCGNEIKDGKPVPCTFLNAIETFNRVVNWFVSIAATLGSLTLAYAGAMMLLNPGNTGKLEEAKEMFKKTMIGLIWILVAWIIVYSLVNRFLDSDINAARFLKSQ